MYCNECGGNYKEILDRLEVNDPYVGAIVIQGVSYFKCDSCDDVLYTEEMARAIEAERNRLMQEILNRFPVSDFVNASETASILGISRQALHKHRRINHGFIYQTTFGGNKIFLTKSVLQFKTTGDGRFPLIPGSRNTAVKKQKIPATVAERPALKYKAD
jgi:hypothetical protein